MAKRQNATPVPETEQEPEIDLANEPAGGEVIATVPRYGRLFPKPDDPIDRCPTSLDLSTPRGKALMLAAGTPGNIEFDNTGRARILATDWAVFPDFGADPATGEQSTFARCVFFTAEGETFRTTSAHAPHQLQRMLDLYKREDWQKGIPILFTERKSRKTGKTYHDFRVEWQLMEQRAKAE